jgi:hypothetical protein
MIRELMLFMWVSCHHGTVNPLTADGGGDLQVWRVEANILSKQLRTADRGCCWTSRVGGRLTN